MSLKQSSGVIINVRDFGESDKIITLYCPTAGKLTCIAKGAKRSQKRFVNKLELFSLLTFHYNDRYALPIMEQAELEESHLELRQKFHAPGKTI